MTKLKAIVVGTAAALALAACGSSGTGAQGSASPSALSSALIAANAGKTLHVVVATLPQFLGNPFQAVGPPRAETTSAIFDALTRVSDTGVLQPWLATSWTRVNDTTWQFALRKDVKFSNGEPFNADSVVATVKEMLGPAGTGTQVRNSLPDIAGAAKVDDYTVTISAKNVNGVLPQQVAAMDVIPPAYWAQVGSDGFAKAPVGTGPYKVKSISTTEWDLVANPTSWRKPIIGNVVIKQLLDLNARTNALRSGQADVTLEGDLDQLDALKSAGVSAYPLQNQGVLLLQFINTSGTPGPLDSADVRLALNYAVNRDALAKSVFVDLAKPANQGLSPSATGFDKSVPQYAYDPAKAKQLLSQAGYANGLSLTAVISIGQFLGDTAVFQAVKNDLAAVGVNLTLNQDTTANLTSFLQKGHWPAQMFSTAYLAAPVQDATRGYFTNSCLKSPGAWCNKAQADLISKAVTQSVGSSERADTLRQLASAIHDNPPGLFLFDVLKLAMAAKNVGGFAQDPSSNTVWEKIYLQ